MKIEIKVIDGPIHLNVPLARTLRDCFHAAAERMNSYPDERPRSRTTSGLVITHRDTLIYLELQQPPRVKVIQPPQQAKK